DLSPSCPSPPFVLCKRVALWHNSMSFFGNPFHSVPVLVTEAEIGLCIALLVGGRTEPLNGLHIISLPSSMIIMQAKIIRFAGRCEKSGPRKGESKRGLEGGKVERPFKLEQFLH